MCLFNSVKLIKLLQLNQNLLDFETTNFKVFVYVKICNI